MKIQTYCLSYSLGGSVKGGAVSKMGHMFEGEGNEFGCGHIQFE